MNKFIKSTLILIIGGFITKILGMIIRIVMTRQLGSEGIGIYMLIMPTFSLLIALAQFGLPVSISKLVSENKNNNTKIIITSIIISILINILIMFFLIMTSDFIANKLLNDSRLYYPLLCISLVLPFISISNIIRSYFFGKQKFIPHVISNISEDIIRLIILSLGIPIFLKMGIVSAVCFIVLSNIISELSSIIILSLFLPHKIRLNKNDFKINNLSTITDISIPVTTSRLVGNIGYFLEPIIITNILLYIGYSNSYIINEYGIITGYVLPILTLPSFFTNAISNALLPTISNLWSNLDKKNTKRKIKQGILFSLIIGIPYTIIIILWPNTLLNFLYNTNFGINYIKILAPIFILSYIQGPLTSVMQAMNLSKKAMKDSLIGIIIRTLLLLICSLFKIGLWGLIIAISLNIIYVTIMHILHIKKALN